MQALKNSSSINIQKHQIKKSVPIQHIVKFNETIIMIMKNAYEL